MTSVKANLLRTAVELGVYAGERHAGFEQHQGGTARLPEARDQWIRGILQGIAEVTGNDSDRLTAAFDQQLEEARGRFGVVPLPLSGQRHVVQTLRWYADDLEGYEGDQRARVMEVKNMLEDFTAYPGWDISNTHVPAARYETEMHLLRMTAQRPIRFTRVVVGGELEPGGIEFVPGLVDDAAGVRRTETFQEAVKEHPERTEWAALCTVYLGGGQQWAIGTVDADELDMAVIREAGDQFLNRPGITAVSCRELCVPVNEITQEKHCSGKPPKRKEAER